VLNNDDITAAYTCTATETSARHLFHQPVLSDPDSRLGNYVVSLTNGTLIINAVNDVLPAGPISGVSNTVPSSNLNATKERVSPTTPKTPAQIALLDWTAPVTAP